MLLGLVNKLKMPFIVKALGSVLGLVGSVLIARFFGQEILGVISLGNRIYQILIIVALFGFREIIIREVSILSSKKNISQAYELIINATFFGLLASATLVIFTELLLPMVADSVFDEPNLAPFFSVFVVGLVMSARVKVIAFVLIGLKQTTKNLIVDGFLMNLTIVLLVTGAYFLKVDLTFYTFGLIYLLTKLISWIVAEVFYKKEAIKPAQFKIQSSYLFDSKKFFGLSIVNIVTANLDIIIVGIFLETRDIALYAVASRIALLMRLLMQVLNAILAPEIADLFSNRKFKSMRVKINRHLIFGLVIGATFVAFVVVLGKPVLGIWGDRFKDAWLLLILLSGGVSIGLIAAPYNILLKMSQKEDLLLKIQFWTGFTYLILCVIFTNYYGLMGAALSFCSHLVISSALMVFMGETFVKRCLAEL
ncbi:MAG: hypothetical protein Roseis2KO_22200 [Roseivirga sp.]